MSHNLYTKKNNCRVTVKTPETMAQKLSTRTERKCN